MNPLRAWNRFWFAPISARPLGAFRIVVGTCLLIHLALLASDATFWLTDQGLLRGLDSRIIAGPLRPSALHDLQDPVAVRLFLAATAAVGLLFTIGWRTRLMGFILYPMLLSIHQRNLASNCGPDNLLLILVFYLVLAPSGAAYSLDARRRQRERGTAAEPLIVPWAQRLIQLHIGLIYLDTAILKCNGATWLNGTALHFVIHNTEFVRFDLTSLTQYPLLINLMTYAALLGEFSLAFLLWCKPARPWVALMGLGLHIGVLAMINVPLFGELTTACYLTFLTPGELDSLLAWLTPWRWGRRVRAALPATIRRDEPATQTAPHRTTEAGRSSTRQLRTRSSSAD